MYTDVYDQTVAALGGLDNLPPKLFNCRRSLNQSNSNKIPL